MSTSKTWTISKDFNLEYGHRVWNQTLDSSLCAIGDDKCACRHIHGHSGKVSLHLADNKLERGMVIDFKMTGFLKDFIDNVLDHKFIIDINDPGFTQITGVDPNWAKSNNHLNPVMMADYTAGWVFDLQSFESPEVLPDTVDYELLEGFFIVDFLPTSENLAKYMFEVAEARLGDIVVGIDWQETAKSVARYRDYRA